MHNIKLNREELIKTIRNNLQEHITEYMHAYNAYLQVCREWLSKTTLQLTQDIDESKSVLPPDISRYIANNYTYRGWVHNIKDKPMTSGELSFSGKLLDNEVFDIQGLLNKADLIAPENHVQDYIKILTMLEMSVDDVVSLTEVQFNQYVMDNWSWTNNFKHLNTTYLSAINK